MGYQRRVHGTHHKLIQATRVLDPPVVFVRSSFTGIWGTAKRHHKMAGQPLVLIILNHLATLATVILDLASILSWLPTWLVLTAGKNTFITHRIERNARLHAFLWLPRFVAVNMAVGAILWLHGYSVWFVYAATSAEGLWTAVAGTLTCVACVLLLPTRGKLLLSEEHLGSVDLDLTWSVLLQSWKDLLVSVLFLTVAALVLRAHVLVSHVRSTDGSSRDSRTPSLLFLCARELPRSICEWMCTPLMAVLCVTFWRTPEVWASRNRLGYWELRQLLLVEAVAGMVDVAYFALCIPPLLLTV